MKLDLTARTLTLSLDDPLTGRFVMDILNSGHSIQHPDEDAILDEVALDYVLVASNGCLEDTYVVDVQGRNDLRELAEYIPLQGLLDLIGEPPEAGLWVFVGKFHRKSWSDTDQCEWEDCAIAGIYKPATPELLDIFHLDYWSWLEFPDLSSMTPFMLSEILTACHASDCKERAIVAGLDNCLDVGDIVGRHLASEDETCTCERYALHG